MRTTITLAADVAAAVERLRRERGVGVSEVVNDLARAGLAGRKDDAAPFTQEVSSMGVPLMALDDVQAVLDVVEGDDRR